MGADRKANTRGGGALEGGDLRLLEDGGKCGGALVLDAVEVETASKGQDGNGERIGMSMGDGLKPTTLWGGGAPERGHGAPLERTAQLGDALSGVGAVAILTDAAELVAGQAATGRRRSECQWALTERQTLGSGGALQRGHSASLEPLAQRNDALSVGNELAFIVVVVPTNTVVTEPGHSTTAVSMGLDRKAGPGGWRT